MGEVCYFDTKNKPITIIKRKTRIFLEKWDAKYLFERIFAYI